MRYGEAHLLGYEPTASYNAAYLLRRRLVDARALGIGRISAACSDVTDAAAVDEDCGDSDGVQLALLRLAAASGSEDASLLLAEALVTAGAETHAEVLLARLASSGSGGGSVRAQASYALGVLYCRRAHRARARAHRGAGGSDGGDSDSGAESNGEAALLSLAAAHWRASVAAAPDEARSLPAAAQLARQQLCRQQRAWATQWLPAHWLGAAASIATCSCLQ